MKKFNLFKMLAVLIVLITSINTAWGYQVWGDKTFYIDNSIVNWSPMHIKFNNSTDNQPWCQAIEGTSYCYYYFANNWDNYDGFTFIQGDNWDSKTAQSTYESYNVQPSSYAVFVIKGETTASGEYKVGFFTDTKRAIKNTRVYFDATPVDGWGDKAYLRYGFDCVAHADAMTKFPGTANLFYIDIKESYYAKYAIANNAGWVGAYNVSQPSKECEPNDKWRITKSLAFSETDINNGYTVSTFVPTNNSATDHGCAWWNYNKNEGSDIPTKTVTISSTTNGKIRVEYTNTDAEETYWEGSGGTTLTVPQSAIITVKALGNAGYDASSITVGGSGFTNGNTYTVTSNITISATFATAYAFVQGRMHVKSGSPSGSWINTFDGEGDSDKWEESSAVIKFTHDGSKYVLHTYVTPSDLSSNFESTLPPYFYVATSSSANSYSGLRKYRPSEGLTITAADSKATIEEFGGTNSVRINSDVTTGYVVLYFDQSKVWYLLEQSLDYAAGGGTGDVPSTAFYMNGASASAVAANTFTAPSGYEFSHWSGSDGYSYAAGGSVTMDANKTLTAIWTQLVTLDANHTGATDGRVTATYNATSVGTITAPTLASCHVVGYYADEDCEHLVMDPDGTLYNYTGYVSGGQWIHSGPTTLYAKWESTNFVIYRPGDKDEDDRAIDDQVETYAGGTIDKTIEYRMKVRDIDTWYALSIPFTVNEVKVWDDAGWHDIFPYYRPVVGGTYYQGYYVLRTPRDATGLLISDFSDWRDPMDFNAKPAKNTPYIILWHLSYFEGKYVSFFGASGQTIPNAMTVGTAPTADGVLNIYANDAMTSGSVTDAYTYVSDYGSGAWLRNETKGTKRTVPAFECYILANGATTESHLVIKRRTGDDTTTGWDDVLNSEYKEVITVYTISGLRVAQYTDCSIAEAGRRMNAELSEGIYILSAGNESVKIMIGGK